MTKVNAKAYPSNLTVPGASTRFLLKPTGTTTVSFEDLCKKIVSGSGLPLSTIKYVAERINEGVTELLTKNCRVHTGTYVASLGIGGSLDAMNDQPNKVANPVHAVITPEGDIVDILKAIEVVNVTVALGAILNEIQEDGCAELNKLTAANTDIVINGQLIDINPSDVDTGVFLCDRTTGGVVKTASITSHDSSRLVVKFAELPTNGAYTIKVLTRNCDSNYDVMALTRHVTVEVAD